MPFAVFLVVGAAGGDGDAVRCGAIGRSSPIPLVVEQKAVIAHDHLQNCFKKSRVR